nr:MAG TPA: hypothetical protein [Caudoviricetes sp.]
MDIEHTAQFLRNKELNGYKLSKEEREFLDRYEQITNDLFNERLEAVY